MRTSKITRLAALATAIAVAMSPVAASAEDPLGGLPNPLAPVVEPETDEGPAPSTVESFEDAILRHQRELAELRLDGPSQLNVERARNAGDVVFDIYLSGFIGEALEELAKAVSELQQVERQHQPAVAGIRNGMARTIGIMATDHIAAAENAGVDRGLTSSARQSMDEGWALADAGDDAGGAHKFVGGFNKIKDATKFDVNVFGQKIMEFVHDDAVGYQFTIGRNGKLTNWTIGNGWSRLSQDEPTKKQWHTFDMITASISKTITAVAVLQLLEEQGKDPTTEKIGPYLPPHWQRGANVDDLTFQELLRHRSGLGIPGTSPIGKWAKAREYVAGGATDKPGTGLRPFEYHNTNTSIVAVLMARLNPQTKADLDSATKTLPFSDETIYSVLVPHYYREHVQQRIFSPAGIEGSCFADANPTLAYSSDKSDKRKGVFWELSGLECAHGGWYLSTLDLTAFMSHLRYGTLLGEDMRKLMFANNLGFLPMTGLRGKYLGHGGELRTGQPADPTLRRQGTNGCAMTFPGGVEASLMINSWHRYEPLNGLPCDVLYVAYEQAWVKA